MGLQFYLIHKKIRAECLTLHKKVKSSTVSCAATMPSTRIVLPFTLICALERQLWAVPSLSYEEFRNGQLTAAHGAL